MIREELQPKMVGGAAERDSQHGGTGERSDNVRGVVRSVVDLRNPRDKLQLYRVELLLTPQRISRPDSRFTFMAIER